MDLESMLVDSSRIIADIVAENVGDSPEHFKKLIDLAFSGKEKIAMRASRVATFCVQKYQHLIEPYLDRIIQELPEDESIRKNFMKILAETPLKFTEEQLGILVDKSFEILMNDKSSIANKAYSMELLYKISEIEPDLKNELIPVIEEQIPTGSSGVKLIGKRLLKKLYKETGRGK
ncbi:MAG: hypothetical protein JSV22_00285 [Bacteroidales bacterium]|nr:MAG: hypothetical protein JSV22_00285 [Bacteroidales bacterium]